MTQPESTRERDPNERKTLEDALDIATAIVERTEQVDGEQYTLAAGFLVLCQDMAAMLDAAKKATHFCGWCQRANSDSRVGLTAMPLDEIREHTVRCEHNPLVQELQRLRAAAPVMLAVHALLNDEIDEAGLRELAIFYGDHYPSSLDTWLDAERAREKAPEVAHAG